MSCKKKDVQKQAEEFYSRLMEDLSRRELSNSENLDRAILYTSLPILGITIGFLNTMPPKNEITCMWAFYLSAMCLVIAIVVVVASYWTSIKAKRELENLKERIIEYYIKRDKKPVSKYNKCTEILNVVSTILYLAGIFSMCGFLYSNSPK